MTIGVLALQGGFSAHLGILEKMGTEVSEVRTQRELAAADALVIPGGESSVIADLLVRNGMFEPLKEKIADGFPVFGTCAGMIMLSKSASGGKTVKTLDVMDIEVERNAYGSQADSFEAPLKWESGPMEGGYFVGIFIRAPKVVSFREDVEVLSSWRDSPVMLHQGNILASSFHPELAGYSGVHEYFINEIVKKAV